MSRNWPSGTPSHRSLMIPGCGRRRRPTPHPPAPVPNREVDMAPVILFTFAGRQRRMEILTRYIQSAMDAGIIDEWHVWDFTRSQDDHEWVTREFGPVRYMGSAAPYQSVGSAARNQPLRLD